MTYAPAKLKELGAYWTAQGGVNLGIVGNAAHTTGYHLGKDRIYDGTGPGIGDKDYSVKTARDKAGLTNAASAIDLGRLDGSLKALRMFSNWLVARCMADPVVRKDIREIIYSPDGATVQRYSGIDNAIHQGIGNGDDSHLTHTHISYFRDSEGRDKTYTFRPYFEEDQMSYPVPKEPSIGDAAKGVRLYVSSSLVANNDPVSGDIILDPGRTLPYLGQPTPAARVVEYVNEAGVHSGKAYFIKTAELTNIRPALLPAPPDTTPFDQDDLDAARLAGADAGAAGEKERLAEAAGKAEADKIRSL